ncbi:MAG: prolyl oligopeptidase family serine peptidase [bacterium]|nr:prolyl oligopeptidase family serine peptidase [bacterium]
MILRTRFKKDIVCEFIQPVRPSRKVIIFCKGMPNLPRFPEVLKFWSKKGFWVFFPRYRGTWESDGEFLKQSPEKDVLDIIDELPKGFTDLWSGKKFKVSAMGGSASGGKSCKVYIFGGSFGGPAAILCSRDPRVTKAVAFAPVIDWEAPSDEPMDKLGAFLPKGFGNGYRFSKKNWLRLSHNEFYSPVKEAGTIDGSKLLIFHAKDDASVPYSYTKKFAAQTGAKLITLRTGGHFGFSKSTEPSIYKQIRKFLK